MSKPARILKLGVLISGGGRTLQNLLDCISAGTLPATVEIVISSRKSAAGIARAERAGVPVEVIPPHAMGPEEFYDRISKTLDRTGIDLVCMCGYVRFWRIPERYWGRVMNIHPALLPKFGGKGFYGQTVHRAVLEAGNKVSGCTVHFVDNEYDHGPIILQRGVDVLADDSVESLTERVFQQEKIAYPDAIRLYAEDRLRMEQGRVKIDPRPA